MEAYARVLLSSDFAHGVTFSKEQLIGIVAAKFKMLHVGKHVVGGNDGNMMVSLMIEIAAYLGQVEGEGASKMKAVFGKRASPDSRSRVWRVSRVLSLTRAPLPHLVYRHALEC